MQTGLDEREPRLKSHLECDFSVPTTASDRGGEFVVVRCPAKINVTLRVLGRRGDGYHELESLVAPVSLCDDLQLAPRPEPGVSLSCDVPGVPVDERNLIVKAALRLAEIGGIRTGLNGRLIKRIPAGGGLGGGSSNAASTLLALNRLWRLDLSGRRLSELAADLGSDVPLFLAGGPAIIRGRGERVEPVELGWHGWIVLVFPGLFVSTPEVFKAWRAEVPVGDTRYADLSWFTDSAGSAAEWMDRTFNMLEQPAMQVCPSLRDLVERLRPMAGRAVRMSGSGSTLFTAYDDADTAEQFAARVRRELNLGAGVVRPITQECAQCKGDDIHGDQ